MAAPRADQPIAGFWYRVGASFIDGFVVVPFTFPTSILVGYGPASVAIAWIVLTFPATWLYTTISHGRWGKTLGKHIMGIHLVRADDGSRIGYREAVLRDLGVIFFSFLGAVFLIRIVLSGETDGFRMFDQPEYAYDPDASYGEVFVEPWRQAFGQYEPAYFVVMALQMGWFLAEVVTMLSNRRRRALHDFIGGTVVVRSPEPVSLPTSSNPVPNVEPPVEIPRRPSNRGF